jgi:hypothetical protein
MSDALVAAWQAGTAKERAHFIGVWSEMFSASFERPRRRATAALRLVPKEPTVN